jgi:hypothetical protein
MKVLVVRDAFTHQPATPEGAEAAPEPRDFAKGEMIRDPAEIQSVEDAGQAHFCTPTEVDESFFAEDPAPKSRRAAAA